MLDKTQYQKLVKSRAPGSRHLQTMLAAFVVGGLICCLGQGIGDILKILLPDAPKAEIGALVSIILIFLGALFTGIGVYDDIGTFAGAGSIVPITGFANSVVAPAMEYKKEGIVFGICAKLFAIAGPIIVFGVVASFLVGVIHLFI